MKNERTKQAGKPEKELYWVQKKCSCTGYDNKKQKQLNEKINLDY